MHSFFTSSILIIELNARSHSDEQIAIVLTAVIKGFMSDINEWSFSPLNSQKPQTDDISST